MTPLSDALTAAQRSALAALEKAYVAGQVDADSFADGLEACGITDPIDVTFLVASLNVLREWGVSAPTMSERVAETKVEKMTAPQRELITKLAQEKKIYLRPGFEGLSKAQASQVITEIQSGTYDSQEDVPF